MNHISTFVVFIFICLSSCGKKNNRPQKSHPILSAPYLIDGQYLGILFPINNHITGPISGAFTWSKEKKEIIADLRFKGGPTSAETIHSQNIHIGSRCPDTGDDLNHDGFIDGSEAEIIVGKILLPLDDVIDNQFMGSGIFPIADSFGDYIYSKSGDYKTLMKDLSEIDFNLNDPFVKLGTDRPLIMETKIILVNGISDTVILPNTLRSNNRLSIHQTFPVACGIIKRILKAPGITYHDENPLPIPNDEDIQVPNFDDGATISIPPR